MRERGAGPQGSGYEYSLCELSVAHAGGKRRLAVHLEAVGALRRNGDGDCH